MEEAADLITTLTSQLEAALERAVKAEGAVRYIASGCALDAMRDDVRSTVSALIARSGSPQ